MSEDAAPYNHHQPGEDDVPLELEVTSDLESKTVILSFNQPIGLLSMDGDQALDIAQRLVHHAKAVGFNKGHTFIL